MSRFKINVRKSEMSEHDTDMAVSLVQEALERNDSEKDVAAYVKKAFDAKYGPTWHSVVGHAFGSYVTHEGNSFVYLDAGSVAILIFKSG